MAVNVTTITATGNDYIDGVSSTAAWGDSVPLDISYSYPAAASNYGAPGSYSPDNEPDSGFAVFNGTQQAFHDAQLLRLSTYYVPITFTKITESDSTHAILRYGNSNVPNPAHGYYPSNVALVPRGGDAWIDPNQFSLGSPAVGNYAGFAHQHELLHTLGLKHAHETPPTGIKVPSDMDYVEFTIMSYRSVEGGSDGAFTIAANNYPTTPMLLDIQVLHRMYGSVAAGSGDIIYHFNPTTGIVSRNGVAAITPPANIIFMTQPPERTSGIISWDCSDYTTDLDIDLRPGFGSVLDAAQLALLNTGVDASANVYVPVMYGGETDAMPTRVILGSGADTIVGNSKANTIVLNGARTDYTFGTSGPNYTLVRSGEGMKTFNGIEFFEFTDGTVPLNQFVGQKFIFLCAMS